MEQCQIWFVFLLLGCRIASNLVYLTVVIPGMKLKTNFSKESPVWLLGKCYHRKESPDVTEMGTDVAAFTSQANVIIL